jgi:1-acyl-sn-glycerol-3-phosphate acyltransferase
MIFLYIILGIIGVELLFVLFTILCSLFVRKDEYTKDNKFYRFLYNIWVMLAVGVCSIKVNVKGREKLPKDSRFLMVENHISNFDAIVTGYAFRKSQLAVISKPEVFKIFAFGKIIKKCCFLAINREDPRVAIETIRKATNLIKNDETSILLYPEGTRSKSGKLLPFHNGTLKIARNSNVPIAVVVIKNTDKVKHNFPFKRTIVTVEVIDVITSEEVRSFTTGELGDVIRNKMLKALDQE